MHEMNVLDLDGNKIKHFTQWDQNQKIIIEGMTFTAAPQVHFYNEKSISAHTMESELLNDIQIVSEVPNDLLTEDLPISISIYFPNVSEIGGKTVLHTRIPVKEKKIPENFIYKNNVNTYDFKDLEDTLNHCKEATQSMISNVETTVQEMQNDVNNAISAANSAEKNANTAAAAAYNAAYNVSNGDISTAIVTFDEEVEHANIQSGETLGTSLGKLSKLYEDLTMLRAQACIFVNESDILGVQVDYKNQTFTRLAGAVNLTSGSDFDKFSMYGGRKRCNVADDGTIVAWYGDADYAEDGSMGQVMVYQPKFYYLVCPVVYDPIDTGIGYHLRKANYYVSEKPRAGFRLHPAFYDANGNEIDYILIGAYEGSIYDSSASEYLLLNEQVMTVGEDKFCSIAGVKPVSGSTQNLTRPNVETLAQNRGSNWHGSTVKIASMNQLLCMIEMGTMNFQSAIGQGVVSYALGSGNEASNTGATSSLGNGTGQATQTTHISSDGTETIDTTSGKLSVSYRGLENPWGNIWEFEYGVNIWGNGSMAGGEPYVADDFNFAESKRTDNYEGAGFTVTNANGYISAMGYSTTCDWLFMASETVGNSSLPVGDYTYVTPNLNGYSIAQLGGGWHDGFYAGGFCWFLGAGVGVRYRDIGGRLVYVPTATA